MPSPELLYWSSATTERQRDSTTTKRQSDIVLDYFPVFYDDVEVWHYTLNFFRDGINMGTIAFEEIELQELINKGEITILSEG